MSVSLTQNFLKNARGLTLTDGGGITWSINPNTNAITASITGSFSGFGNPTTKVGLTAVNGVATTAMRSDAAPALDVTISPTWTGTHTFANNVLFSGALIITHTFASWNGTNFVIDSAGFGTKCGGTFGWNGAAPPAQVTGFGTPVGGAVVNNYNITDAGGANSNTNKCVAEILAIMKAHGMIGA